MYGRKPSFGFATTGAGAGAGRFGAASGAGSLFGDEVRLGGMSDGGWDMGGEVCTGPEGRIAAGLFNGSGGGANSAALFGRRAQ